MKLVNCLILIFSLTMQSQVIFEKGYFINNAGQKTDCLIKNLDWRYNPINFEYKTNESSNPLNADIKAVSEFGIYNSIKFVRYVVQIDDSNENINNLNQERNPIFIEQQLFLKVLIESKASLYSYKSVGAEKFFFKDGNLAVKQLIYKKYIDENNNVLENNSYRQQLANILKCEAITMSEIQKLQHKENSLLQLFLDFSACSKMPFTIYNRKIKKDLFNLTFRIHINNAALSINNTLTKRFTDLDNEISFGFGAEAEFILPFNKNKWAIMIEPTYQYYISDKTAEDSQVSGGQLTTSINYNAIEIPVGVRHYIFLNNNSKMFINASYYYNLDTKSTLEFKRTDESSYNSLKIKSKNNLGFGIGYKYLDKYSLELRYQANRNILGNYSFWQSNYSKISVSAGYSFF